jgi:hypothetical protein
MSQEKESTNSERVPPAIPKPVLPYNAPPPFSDRSATRAFGSFGGNMAVGLGIFVASLVVGTTLGVRLRNAGPVIVFGPAGVVLGVGIVAAFFPRYRGVLTGMLLVILILLGVLLLIIGICSGFFK